ncbi:MAG: amino acid ABC transporter ATP-binding protein [Lachnospirales bacterium]
MAIIKVNNLKKSFGELEVLKDISLEVNKGDVIAILGPSGSGKSTFLRSLIDLESVDGGDIIIEGEYLCKNGVYPKEKNIRKIISKMGMVFQHFNLFPHMSIRKNLTLAPELNKQDKKENINKQAEIILDKVGVLDKIDAYPSTLSGGQKQRVAIARALMRNPDIILFDEPTSALDPELTGEVLKVIRDLANEGNTMLIVTHEINFAYEVASKILFLDNGYVADFDTPERVLKNPKTERIAAFIKKVNEKN